MKMWKMAACVGALSLALAGCAQMQQFEQRVSNAYSTLTSAQVKYQYVVAGIQTYQGLKKIGAAYLRLPTCTSSSGPICHDRHATAPIRATFTVGDKARDDAIAFVDAHPCVAAPDGSQSCPLMPDGVYAGIRSAITELQGLYDTYQVSTGAK